MAQAIIPGAPAIVPEAYALEQKIFPGSAGSRAFFLENEGESDLLYVVHKDTFGLRKNPRSLGDYADKSRVADPGLTKDIIAGMYSLPFEGSRDGGDILGIFTGGAQALTGITWVGDMLYMTDMKNNFLLRYDTALKAVTDTAVIHEDPFSIAWDGEYLWVGDNTGNVYAYANDGTAAGYSFSCPVNGYSTLAWDGEFFRTNSVFAKNPVIWQVDETGAVHDSIPTSIDKSSIWQLAYAASHYTGQFWFTNNSGRIYQLNVDETGLGHVVQSFSAPFNVSYSLVHDQNDLWYGKTGGVVYRIDDGFFEVNWLRINPGEGLIQARHQQQLSLFFDAGRSDPGSQKANLSVINNDPANPEVRIPVEMKVVEGISLGPDTSFCGHMSIALDAGEGFAGYLWSDGSREQILVVDSAGYGTGEETIWVDVTDIGGVTKRDSISVKFLDCASVTEFSSGLKVVVYPNPNEGRFTIRAEGANEKVRVTVTDATGNELLNHEMSSPGKEELDLSACPKGQYFLFLSSKSGMNVMKVMVF
jgi:hypothetical protein